MLDALDANGLAESTAVVVHSDHGWHLGEYNMWEKRTLWENAARVPLIIRVPWLPGSAGKRATQLVELVDIYRTVCDLLGADLPGDDAHAVEGAGRPPLTPPPLEPLTARQTPLQSPPVAFAVFLWIIYGFSVSSVFGFWSVRARLVYRRLLTLAIHPPYVHACRRLHPDAVATAPPPTQACR